MPNVYPDESLIAQLAELRHRVTPEDFVDEGAETDKVLLAGLLQRFDLDALDRIPDDALDAEYPDVDRALIALHQLAADLTLDDFCNGGFVDPQIVEIANVVADVLVSYRFYVMRDARWVRDEASVRLYREVRDRPPAA